MEPQITQPADHQPRQSGENCRPKTGEIPRPVDNLHYALDLWTERWRRREATGDMIIVRYADDFIIGFQHEEDARRFLDEMRERLREFALSLHPEKTRLIEFGRFAAERRLRRGLGKPETSTSWALPSSVARPAPANSSFGGRAGGTA